MYEYLPPFLNIHHFFYKVMHESWVSSLKNLPPCYPSFSKKFDITVFSHLIQINFLLTYFVKNFKKFLKKIPKGVSFSGRGTIIYASPCNLFYFP